jgi:GLPGLI family protein
MKKIILLLLTGFCFKAGAQQNLASQAIITTKTTISSPEGDETPAGNFTSENGEQVRVMRFGGDGETKTTTWLKNDLVKTFSESEMGRTTVIRDNSKKLTTTIMEMMGRKTGFYATDADQEEMRKRMDSMMQGRNPNASPQNRAVEFSIEYREETKKLAGYECKKALIIGIRTNRKDTTIVWYVPGLKLQNLGSTGGAMGGFGGFVNQPGGNGMEKLDGFPMEYERSMGNGRKMTVQVTKLITDKEITDKEFEIPKDIEVKPMKDMQTGGGPGFRMRVGG